MDQAKIDEIVGEWVKEGIHIFQETVEYLLWYCNRKMDVCRIENREEYLPLLYTDEVKNHLFRQSINATAMVQKLKRGWRHMRLATPCRPGYLNTPDLVPVYKFCKCGYCIHEGERYYYSSDGYVCEDCAKDMTAREFMKLIGGTFSTAKKEE